MTNRLLVLLLLPAAASMLASCSSTPSCGNSHPYTGAAMVAPIKAPAGVTLPPADPAYKLPAAGTAAMPVAAPAAGTASAPCLVTPPSVLTNQDMVKPIPLKPASKPVAAPPAGTKTQPKPVPAAASNPPPVAGG